MSDAGLGLGRVGKRAGAFDTLAHDQHLVPGSPAPSVEGWVLFVSNLAPTVTEDHIKDAFASLGGKPTVRFNLSTRECGCPGHAFVEFAELSVAQNAIATLNGQELEGQPMRVGFAFVVPNAQQAVVATTAAHDKRERGSADLNDDGRYAPATATAPAVSAD